MAKESQSAVCVCVCVCVRPPQGAYSSGCREALKGGCDEQLFLGVPLAAPGERIINGYACTNSSVCTNQALLCGVPRVGEEEGGVVEGGLEEVERVQDTREVGQLHTLGQKQVRTACQAKRRDGG